MLAIQISIVILGIMVVGMCVLVAIDVLRK
jgi:hypothetical protein